MEKKCPTCNQSKPLTEFVKDKSIKSGYGGYCKPCKSKKQSNWRANHPGYDKRHSATRKAGYSQEYMNEYHRERRKKDPSHKLRQTIRASVRNYLFKVGEKKNKSTGEMLGCSNSELKKWIENQWVEGMSWSNYGKKKGCWNIDHITPLGPSSTKEEIYELNHYTNLQPLWWDENIRKRDKILDNPK